MLKDAPVQAGLRFVPRYAHHIPQQSSPRMVLLLLSQHRLLSAAADLAYKITSCSIRPVAEPLLGLKD